MTQTTRHDYGASIYVGTTRTTLRITGGSITLDADRVPHVQGSVTVAVVDAAILAALDPRLSPRVFVQASVWNTRGTLVYSRPFDLGLRSATPNRADGTVVLELASDETLLSDVAPLADDTTPRTLETSLRAVVDYVLGTVGASLEPGTVDADVTAYWPLTNIMTNPSVVNSSVGFSAGPNTSTAEYSTDYGYVGSSSMRWVSSAADTTALLHCRSFPVSEGESYVMSAYATTLTGRLVRMMARWRDPDGNVIRDTYGPLTTATGLGNWERVSQVVIAPKGAANLSFNIGLVANAAGQTTYADAFMLHEGDEVVPYFDGSTASAGYVTVWDEAAHRSSSRRIPNRERDPESLTWRAGQSAMEFLHGLLSAAGLRLVCDEQRRWTLRDAEYRAPNVLTYRYGVNITAAEEKLSRDDESWFDAAVYEYTWTTPRDGREHRRTDAFALTDPPTKTLRVELPDTPYPGPGRAEHIVNRAQGKGREVTVTAIPTWREVTDQPIMVTLDGTPIQTGIASSVRFDLDTDTVTVASRTTDTIPSAWALLPVGETWLDSPIGESWIEEVI